MTENKNVEHLQMIQGIITRMGQNSFQLKGWAIGIMIAIFTFAGQQGDTRSILFTIIPLTVIWLLDSYYLQLERKFRLLYDDVRKNKEKTDFDMSFNSVKLEVGKHNKISYFRIMFSITETPFYLVCIITTILIYQFA